MYTILVGEYLGLLKSASDKDNIDGFRILLHRAWPENIDPAFKLPAALEYAAPRGQLIIMNQLHQLGVSANGNEWIYPLSTAVTVGSIEAVKLLLA
jgi:hypothetical protein